jgi:hypothetical protein
MWLSLCTIKNRDQQVKMIFHKTIRINFCCAENIFSEQVQKVLVICLSVVKGFAIDTTIINMVPVSV